MSKQARNRHAVDLPRWLAYLYKPLQPIAKKLERRSKGSRDYDPRDIGLPPGYRCEFVAGGFNAPVHCCFDANGDCYVIESGHKVQAPPRIFRVDRTGANEEFFVFPHQRWNKTGAVTGGCWLGDQLYICNTDTLSRISRDGRIEDLIQDLPGRGDHQVNHPIVGSDSKLYFGVGSVTNNGVVGPDNFAYEWLPNFPGEHDVPAKDIVLRGGNYESKN